MKIELGDRVSYLNNTYEVVNLYNEEGTDNKFAEIEHTVSKKVIIVNVNNIDKVFK